MNLKESFRYQNRISRFLREAQAVLSTSNNCVQVTRTSKYNKVDKDLSDESVVLEAPSEYSDRITSMVDFAVFLVEQKAALAMAIHKAKAGLDFDLDGEVGLNSIRQDLANTLGTLASLRGTEREIPNGGTGYRFNAEGNQVTFRCDVKEVTVINYDRNVVQKHLKALNAKSEQISSDIDKCLIMTEVDYAAPFSINDSFKDAFDAFCEAHPIAKKGD